MIILVVFAATYFLFIRPQQRRAREAQAMQSKLGPGDEVMTTSGIYGRVIDIDDEAGTVGLEISPDVVINVARAAVGKVVTSAASQVEEIEEASEPDSETDSADYLSTSAVDRKD